MEGPQSAGLISTVGPLTAVYKVTFGTAHATQIHGSASHGIPVLPSDQGLQPTNIKRYVVVELSNKSRTVSLVIDATNVYLLGYRPGVGTASYFFKDVDPVVRNLFFQDTARTGLDFNSTYPGLQAQAGENRDQIPLGFAEVRQKIENLNDYNPLQGTEKEKKFAKMQIAKALIVCIEMISEAARLKVIQQQLAKLAPVVEGGPDKTLDHPRDLGSMIEFQNGWTQLSEAIQNANPNRTFRTDVTVNHITYTNVDSVRPLIAILKRAPTNAFSATSATVVDQVIDAGCSSECEHEGESTYMQ